MLGAQTASGIRGGRVVHRFALDEIAGDTMPPEPSNEIAYGIVTELPDSPAGGAAVASSQMSETTVGLLQQKGGAGDGAATSNAALFQH